MRFAWFPWKFIIRSAARTYGFLDPFVVWGRVRRFAQPAEVAAPTELLRSAMVLHARGLINSQAIQQNLDWVWPYWVVRQFNPHDDAFVPRAFSLTHINLTHRNWTALGVPDCAAYPLVDPRGLLTPLFDGWSLDVWVLTDDGQALVPSRLASAEQRLIIGTELAVVTRLEQGPVQLQLRAQVERMTAGLVCQLHVTTQAPMSGWVVVALRPYNPEGVSFVHDVTWESAEQAWRVNKRATVRFNTSPDRLAYSGYGDGDVFHRLQQESADQAIHSDVGMVTAAALFRLEAAQERQLTVEIPLTVEPVASQAATSAAASPEDWTASLRGHCTFQVADPRVKFLYDAALRSLVLHAPGDVFPGPYTYRRFWFRDAAFILRALLCAGLTARARRALDLFPSRQHISGYFFSQDGEWDSNGEALWALHQWCALTATRPPQAWRRAIVRGAQWIMRKRVSDQLPVPHAGLLPAGFSAEHLGPNDFYYWDDFWGVAGLRAAAAMLSLLGQSQTARQCRHEADRLLESIDRSLAFAAERLGRPAMPASPYRRLDAGMIGSLAAGYPLQLFDADDARLLDSVRFLLEHTFVRGGFYQEMSHSGMNPYLSLHVAQVLLRAGDPRWAAIMDAVAVLASPTGQWPEAIHPRTLGGCMGDGQHVWASAEWVLMVRNCFVREEGDRVILGSGVRSAWYADQAATFGPAPTAFGPVSVQVEPRTNDHVRVSWQGRWHEQPPTIEVRVPGTAAIVAQPDQQSAILEQV